jgi:phage repressor protein C with HTH and peptisase S24 domain
MTKPHLDSPHERLAWAREQAGFTDKADFARAAGVNATTYRAYENGQNGFAKYASLFARKLGVTAEWLMEGGPTPTIKKADREPEILPVVTSEEGSVPLRRLDMSLSMGDGSNIDDYFDEGVFEFDANMLRMISRAPPERLIVGDGIGDSMFPTIHDRDIVIFDTTQQRLNTTDKIWAISLFGAGGIKRLRPVSRDRVLVMSDNPSIPDQEVSAEDLRILGRVIWSARRH